MIFLKRILFYLFSFCILALSMEKANAFPNSAPNPSDNTPTIRIHDTLIDPGELLLQMDALNFVGDNGQVAAITLHIEIDTFLLHFIDIQNMTIAGYWLANYNLVQNEITITYTAPFGMGNDINGKLLDLHLRYFGGFQADLKFKSNCEVANVNLQTIQGVVYEDGSVNQTTPVGTVTMDSVVALFNQPFTMPIEAMGTGYDSINKVRLRMGYDTMQMEYAGFVESALTNVSVADSNAVLTIEWQDTTSVIDFTAMDTLLFINFTFKGDTNQSTPFLHGSEMYNNNRIVASSFVDGYVTAELLVDLQNNPDTAGTVYGGGYYFPGDSVTVTSVPNFGFHFLNWTQDHSVVSSDSVYTFIKQYSNDTLTANYEANVYHLLLLASPFYGGTVYGTGYYPYGDSVTVTAVPAEGYSFSYWAFGDSIVSYDSSYSFVMPDYSLSLVATFQIMEYTITAQPNNASYGTVQGGGNYYYGDTATLIATPNENFNFIVWTEQGQVVSYDSIYSFFVNADRDLIANFQYNTTCSAPVGLYADNLSYTSAILHWTPSGNESQWDVQWGETGFDTLTGGTLITGISETHLLLDSLNQGTSYDFYVRSVCTDQMHSVWAGPCTFSTWYVGIKTQDEQEKFSVYPNPADNVLHITFPNKGVVKRYRILNSLGRLLQKGKTSSGNHFSIRMDDLPNGVYLLKLFTENRVFVKIFIKK